MTGRMRCAWVGLCTIFLMSGTAGAQQTGTIIGAVRDAQGGVLPGVTVTISGEALIGGSNTVTTGEAGAYQFTTLPPGTYTLSYELTGFTPVRREGIVIQVARTTRIDVELGVGTLEETVTVSGESPVVDVSSTVTQTNISRDLYEAIPDRSQSLGDGRPRPRSGDGTSRRRRHRGCAAVQHRSLRLGQQSEVLLHRWPEGELGRRRWRGHDDVLRVRDVRRVQHADGVRHRRERRVRRVHEHGHEVGRQPRDIRPQLLLYEREHAGIEPGRRAACAAWHPARPADGAAGNPIDISYDWSSTLGGPIRQDRAWFFGAIRWWRLDQFQSVR